MNSCFKLTIAGAVVLAAGAAVIAAEDEMAKTVSAGEIEWSPAPDILPEGIELAVLAGNPADGLFVMRVRIPDGTEIAPHWESANEHITVLEGTFHVGMGETFDKEATTPLAAGAFSSMPAEAPHFAWAEGTTVVESVGIGPSEFHYVNPEDNPSQQAME